ncbi:MAG: hypothetical protein ABEH78_07985 [Haloferacaceae archaeon]
MTCYVPSAEAMFALILGGPAAGFIIGAASAWHRWLDTKTTDYRP